jgi:hypothetical protein
LQQERLGEGKKKNRGIHRMPDASINAVHDQFMILAHLKRD